MQKHRKNMSRTMITQISVPADSDQNVNYGNCKRRNQQQQQQQCIDCIDELRQAIPAKEF